MFLKAYDGDLTDVVALKSEARSLGAPFRWENE
jgi:hypothetical protein